MKVSLQKTIFGLVIVALIGLVLYGAVLKIVDNKTELLQAELQNRIESQTILLAAIADATKRNNAVEPVSLVVRDCATDKRKMFDTLLDKLSTTISGTELTELSELFYQCGNFYALQRSLMTLVLNREVEALNDAVNLSLLTSASTTAELTVKTWQDIASSEIKISSFFDQLVMLQGSIITALQSGKNSSSPEVTAVLVEVAQVRGQMVVLSKQVDDLRSALPGI